MIDIRETLRGRHASDTEAVALRALALRPEVPAAELMRSQLKSGAWSAFPAAGPPNAYHTSLALLALRSHERSRRVIDCAERAFAWLDSLEGAENHWLWKWKFRYFDQEVRFDPVKSGWPWVRSTVSWVAPTAMALLAYQAWNRQSPRLLAAVEMLRDRACSGGGWNAGNSIVFDVALDPHPDFTAMALLALRPFTAASNAVEGKGTAYLARCVASLASPYSLAWATVALTAYDHLDAVSCRHRLAERLTDEGVDRLPVGILALSALALEMPPFTFQGTRV